MADVQKIKNVSIFGRLSGQALEELAAALQERQLAAGEVLFNQGDRGDEMLLIDEGRVAIYVPSADRPGEEPAIRIFEAGEVLGEMALISGQPRSLSARALGPGRVQVLSGDDFRRLLAQQPDTALAVMAELSDRIRYTTDFLSEVQTWVRRVAEGNYDRTFKPSVDLHDRSVAALAAEFAQMAARVQEREEALRKEVIQLRIEIDEVKKQRQVEEIVESEYFQQLRARSEKMRRRDKESS